MAVEWTGIGPELLIGLDRSARAGGESLGRQAQRQLRDAIRSGRLERGERLPSTRALAAQLGVSRGVVVDCYAQLESEGYLVTQVGSGTLVAPDVTVEPAGPGAGAPPPADTDTGRAPAARRLDVDFEYGVPDLGGFPLRDWSWALGAACRTASVADLGDEPGTGSERLRRVLAAYVRRVRGSSVAPGDVVVCPGFRHGLNLVFRALAAAGVERVALEDPGPLDHDTIAERSGLAVVPVPVDGDGVDVAALAASGARAVLVTPAHQCPTGVVLAPERRRALLDWARRVDGFVLEDDYDAEFRYDRRPVGSLQGLAPDRVVALGSVSKTLAPALRIGWVACPPRLLTAVAREKQLLGRGVPGIDQLALAELVESGRFDRHLRTMRGVYGRRREALVAALAEHVPTVSVTGLAAGCHAVLRLPDGVSESAVVTRAAAERSVGLYGMGRYRLSAPPPAGPAPPAELVLGFGNVTEDAIRRGVRAVADLLQGG